LQLQDRIKDAIKLFKTVDEPKDGKLRVQYDYLLAYFDFYEGAETGYQHAKRIA